MLNILIRAIKKALNEKVTFKKGSEAYEGMTNETRAP